MQGRVVKLRGGGSNARATFAFPAAFFAACVMAKQCGIRGHPDMMSTSEREGVMEIRTW